MFYLLSPKLLKYVRPLALICWPNRLIASKHHLLYHFLLQVTTNYQHVKNYTHALTHTKCTNYMLNSSKPDVRLVAPDNDVAGRNGAAP